MANKLGLTRDQLATFLKDPEQIKQFERLFTTVDQTVTIILPAIDTDAGIVESQAQEVTGLINALGQAVTAQIGSVQSATDQLTAQITELAVEVQGIESRHEQELANQAEATKQSVSAQIGLLQSSADQLTAQLTELAAEVQGIESRQDETATGRIKRLQDEIDGLSSLVAVQHHPKRRRLGNFYDTTTQSAAVINTAYAITFNTSDVSDGVYIGSPSSRIYVDTEATYNFQFSAQLDNTSGGNHLAYVWYRVNGADVANSASQVRLKGSDGELVAAWNFVAKLKAGDYFQLMWAVSDTAVQLVAQAAAAPVPAIPSAILSVTTAD